MIEKEKLKDELLNLTNEFKNIKSKMLNLLNYEISNENPEINEKIHIRLYDLNKILEKFEYANTIIDNIKLYEMKKNEFHNFFNDIFIHKMKTYQTDINNEIYIAEEKLNIF